MPEDDLQEWHDHLFQLLAEDFTMRHVNGLRLVAIRERVANIRLLAAQLRCLNSCAECRQMKVRQPT